MDRKDAEQIVKYRADIPRRIAYIRRLETELEDGYDTLKGVNMDGMPHSGAPGDSVANAAVKMAESGAAERLREMRRLRDELEADQEAIQRQIDRMNSIHMEILTEYYLKGRRWEDVVHSVSYSVQHLYRLRNDALDALGWAMESVPECADILNRARYTRGK